MTRYYCNVGHMDVEKQIWTANKLATKYGVRVLPKSMIRDIKCLQFVWYSDTMSMLYNRKYDLEGVQISAGCNNLGEM